MRLMLAEPFKRLWQGKDPFVAVDALQGTIFREMPGRRTLRTEVGGESFFVKIHRGIGWREILKNWFSFRQPVLGAGQELAAIDRLTSLGVATMTAVAFGERGLNPARQQSFIITRELAPTISLEDYCRDWPACPPTWSWKQALIRRVAEMARAMHLGGVNHRDFYLCHFLLHLDPSPTNEAFTLSLIDLHRAQCRSQLPRRWRDKDLASLYFSVLEIGLTQRDFIRFLQIYFARPWREIVETENVLLAHLTRQGQRLSARYWRKEAEGNPL